MSTEQGRPGSGSEVERLRPVVLRQELAQPSSTIAVEDDLGVEILRVELAHELSATTAWRQHIEAA